MTEFMQLSLCLDLVFANNDIKENEEFTPVFICMNRCFLRSVFKLNNAYKYDKTICTKYRTQLKEWEDHDHKIFDFDLNTYVNFNNSVFANYA